MAMSFILSGAFTVYLGERGGGGGLELEMRQFNEVLIFTGTEHRPRDPRWMFARRAALRFFFRLSCFCFFKSETSFNRTLLITNIPICPYCYYYHRILFCTQP